LAGVIRRQYPRGILWMGCGLLLVANIINIGADLGGMGDATEMATGISSLIWTPIYTALIIALLLWTSYRHIARVFKWLTLVLFAYIGAAFLAQPDWAAVAHSTFIPHIEWSSGYLTVFVGIIGTTISPYLFFWQASQEVENERSKGRRSVGQRKGATKAELKDSFVDTVAGMTFSNVVMYFII